jgi:hypothetical protein
MPPSVPPRGATTTHRQTRSRNQTRFLVRIVTALRVNRPMILTASPAVGASEHLQRNASRRTAPRFPYALVGETHQGTVNGQGLPGCRNEILRHLARLPPREAPQGRPRVVPLRERLEPGRPYPGTTKPWPKNRRIESADGEARLPGHARLRPVRDRSWPLRAALPAGVARRTAPPSAMNFPRSRRRAAPPRSADLSVGPRYAASRRLSDFDGSWPPSTREGVIAI